MAKLGDLDYGSPFFASVLGSIWSYKWLLMFCTDSRIKMVELLGDIWLVFDFLWDFVLFYLFGYACLKNRFLIFLDQMGHDTKYVCLLKALVHLVHGFPFCFGATRPWDSSFWMAMRFPFCFGFYHCCAMHRLKLGG